MPPLPLARLLGVFTVSLATLMLELTLTRLFSATMFYHFAFLAISLALFGSGASGVFVYLARPRLDDERTARLMAIACALFAASTVAALFVILAHPLSPFSPGLGILLSLAWIYGAAALPFFFAGCVITLAISAWTREINRLYLFDLAGAALGCLLLVPALGTLGAIDTVLLVALLACVAGWLLSGRRYEGRDFFAAPGLRVGPFVAWIAGFALYQWIGPVGPTWWTDVVERTNPPSTQIGASLPSFALAFALASGAIYLERLVRRPAAEPA